MDYNRLGHSGLRVPALSFGTATFGGTNDFFKAWGSTDASGASRLIDVCLDHGVSLFDSADIYSDGAAETILGAAIKGKRNRLMISTKATFPSGDGPNDFGSSRFHLIEAVDASLKRSVSTISTCFSCMARTTTPRLRRRCRPSTKWSVPVKFAILAGRTSPAGT